MTKLRRTPRAWISAIALICASASAPVSAQFNEDIGNKVLKAVRDMVCAPNMNSSGIFGPEQNIEWYYCVIIDDLGCLKGENCPQQRCRPGFTPGQWEPLSGLENPGSPPGTFVQAYPCWGAARGYPGRR